MRRAWTPAKRSSRHWSGSMWWSTRARAPSTRVRHRSTTPERERAMGAMVVSIAGRPRAAAAAAGGRGAATARFARRRPVGRRVYSPPLHAWGQRRPGGAGSGDEWEKWERRDAPGYGRCRRRQRRDTPGGECWGARRREGTHDTRARGEQAALGVEGPAEAEAGAEQLVLGRGWGRCEADGARGPGLAEDDGALGLEGGDCEGRAGVCGG